MNRSVVISGCSGGGKSTLLAEMQRRGFTVVEEPGRRVIRAQFLNCGKALPWIDLKAFLHCVVDVALEDIASFGKSSDWVFFDRSLVDAIAGLRHLGVTSVLKEIDLAGFYHSRVFLTPPWSEIYVQDAERRHTLDTATAEYERLLQVYPSLGYDVTVIPKTSVMKRADFVLDQLKNCDK